MKKKSKESVLKYLKKDKVLTITRPIFIAGFFLIGVIIISISYPSGDFENSGKYFLGGIFMILSFSIYGSLFLN